METDVEEPDAEQQHGSGFGNGAPESEIIHAYREDWCGPHHHPSNPIRIVPSDCAAGMDLTLEEFVRRCVEGRVNQIEASRERPRRRSR